MSYSIITAIFLATFTLSLGLNPIFDNENNVLVRFYSDFAQLYRPVTLKSYVDPEQTIVKYQFYFPEKEYVRVSEDSLSMLYTNVIERTITYYPTPNFMVNGTRYFYRPSPQQNYTVEIELVNSVDRLFREVNQPDRYFYLSSYDYLQYVDKVPVMPYYEVTFLCNATVVPETQSPVLSYIDRNLQYTPRYILDLSSLHTDTKVNMYAYADIRNTGEKVFVVKGAELIAGDVSLAPGPLDYLRATLTSYSSKIGEPTVFTRPLGEKAIGTYVYQLSLPSPLTIPANSLKSVPFLDSFVTVEPFHYYSSVFAPVNSYGKLSTAYNLTTLNNFLPNGRLLIREQGRYLGQIDLPNLPVNGTYTMIFGVDSDVTYRRKVTIISDYGNLDSTTYYVEYVFENSKLARDVQIYFLESFNVYKYFKIEDLTVPTNNKNNLLNIKPYGTDLRGYIFVPRQGGRTMVSYSLVVYKNKFTIDI